MYACICKGERERTKRMRMKRRNARWLQASWMKSYKKMVPGEQQSFRRRRREIGAK